MLIKSIVNNSTAMFSLKTWRDSNPGLLFLRRMRCPLRHAARAFPHIHNIEPNVPVCREYYDDVHRVCVPKPMEGEKLGLTVQQSGGCVVVTRSVPLLLLRGDVPGRFIRNG
jgi:hypothetical protein